MNQKTLEDVIKTVRVAVVADVALLNKSDFG